MVVAVIALLLLPSSSGVDVSNNGGNNGVNNDFDPSVSQCYKARLINDELMPLIIQQTEKDIFIERAKSLIGEQCQMHLITCDSKRGNYYYCDEFQDIVRNNQMRNTYLAVHALNIWNKLMQKAVAVSAFG